MAGTQPDSNPNAKEIYNWFGSTSDVSWKDYDTLRPGYPEQLFDTILDYMQRNNSTDRQLAIDYGSGTGVVVPRMLEHIGVAKVIGADVAERQLEEGKKQLRTQYGSDRFDTVLGAAGQLHSIPDASVDLVTAAESVHWFDQASWFLEVARVLRPTGTLAIWHYPPHPFIISNEKATQIWHQAFMRILDVGVPKGIISIDQVLVTATLLDNIVVDQSKFVNQERYKWLLPKAIQDRVERCADFAMNDDPYTEEQATAGLLAAPNTKIYEITPDSADQTIMWSTAWTVKHLVQYLGTMGISIEESLSDAIFMQYIHQMEDVVGGPSGTFDVGWSLGLVLATRA